MKIIATNKIIKLCVCLHILRMHTDKLKTSVTGDTWTKRQIRQTRNAAARKKRQRLQKENKLPSQVSQEGIMEEEKTEE